MGHHLSTTTQSNNKTVRIGSGGGYANDRIAPAVDLIERAELDYLSLDCLAERTLAFAQTRILNGGVGYDENLVERTKRLIIPCVQHGTKFLANLGAADPASAAAHIREVLAAEGHRGVKVAAVLGDDVLDQVRKLNPQLDALGKSVEELGDHVISANAYIGADRLVEGLGLGAQVLIGGRIADPSLFLAPLWFEHGWDHTNLDAIASGQFIGHLMECGAYLTGANISDPPYVDVPELWNLGNPIADVAADGSAEFWKLPGTGGRLDTLTCRSQSLYEMGDPSAYLTPDVSLDVTAATFEMTSTGRVAMRGARGNPAPEQLKVLVGVDEGHIAEAEIGFAGPGALTRARLSEESFRREYEANGNTGTDFRTEFVGFDSMLKIPPTNDVEPPEVRLRVAGRFTTLAEANAFTRTLEWQLFGVGGTGGWRTATRPLIGLHPVYIDRSLVETTVVVEES